MDNKETKTWPVTLEDSVTLLNWFQDELGRTRKERDLLRDEISALEHTIVSTVGGVDYEGFPTSELNYLQRLRILVEMERRYRALLETK